MASTFSAPSYTGSSGSSSSTSAASSSSSSSSSAAHSGSSDVLEGMRERARRAEDAAAKKRTFPVAAKPSNPDPNQVYHASLLQYVPEQNELAEAVSTPLFTRPVLEHAQVLAAKAGQSAPFPQYALLAKTASIEETPGSAEAAKADPSSSAAVEDRRIFYNVAAPSSVFICGSQGSGKSHTLSCLLEGCLIQSKLGELPNPLTGIVFHYDTFISDFSGQACEAAYLGSHPQLKVRVLCAPTNPRTIKRTYASLPNVQVEELRLSQADLNTKRMLDLMAVGNANGSVPLYIHVVQRILRDMRIAQQRDGSSFNYRNFVQMIAKADLTEFQKGPLQQRLDTLESFMVPDHVPVAAKRAAAQKAQPAKGTDWKPKQGQLTIVDLSCPCVTPEMACSLFNICLSLFLEQRSGPPSISRGTSHTSTAAAEPANIGLVIALDEAHKYMGESAECQTFTNQLLSTIRLQRHLGARILISTQEPTISPKLLDLCSLTVVHRFTSPDWLRVLRGHLAGISTATKIARQLDDATPTTEEHEAQLAGVAALSLTTSDPTLELFSRIVQLRVGEALVFAPSAIVSVAPRAGAQLRVFPAAELERLAHRVLRVRIRNRVTADGGQSVMAV